MWLRFAGWLLVVGKLNEAALLNRLRLIHRRTRGLLRTQFGSGLEHPASESLSEFWGSAECSLFSTMAVAGTDQNPTGLWLESVDVPEYGSQVLFDRILGGKGNIGSGAELEIGWRIWASAMATGTAIDKDRVNAGCEPMFVLAGKRNVSNGVRWRRCDAFAGWLNVLR